MFYIGNIYYIYIIYIFWLYYVLLTNKNTRELPHSTLVFDCLAAGGLLVLLISSLVLGADTCHYTCLQLSGSA